MSVSDPDQPVLLRLEPEIPPYLSCWLWIQTAAPPAGLTSRTSSETAVRVCELDPELVSLWL